MGGLFSAQVTFNPFFASFNPSEQAKQGPLRWLPVELTLVNDLPINTQANRARVWFGECATASRSTSSTTTRTPGRT